MDAVLKEFMPYTGASHAAVDAGTLGIINRPAALAPADDLAFGAYQDCETAGVIRQLMDEKLAAIRNEDFRRAAHIKHCVTTLLAAGEELGHMEKLKSRAVAEEDFDVCIRLHGLLAAQGNGGCR